MSAKPKHKYRVYRHDTQCYDNERYDETERDYGITYAVSEAQAINNIMFRHGIKPGDCYSDGWADNYWRETTFRAEIISGGQ